MARSYQPVALLWLAIAAVGHHGRQGACGASPVVVADELPVVRPAALRLVMDHGEDLADGCFPVFIDKRRVICVGVVGS